jgi:hypothetical protein
METLTPEIKNINKDKPKIEEHTSEIMLLAISNNFLAIVKHNPPRSGDDFDILLDGNDNNITIVGANTLKGYKEMYHIIDSCYLARETGQTLKIMIGALVLYFH